MNLYIVNIHTYHNIETILVVAESEKEATEKGWKAVDYEGYGTFAYLVDEVDGWKIRLEKEVS